MLTSRDVRRYACLIFKACDKRHTGSLGKEEFYKFMKFLGQPVKRADKAALFKRVDVDGNGTIDLTEILERIQFQISV
jgi:Ca2+-binding EF-hand superfamily protein